MTSPGSPGLSSQSVSAFCSRTWPKKSETESLGNPGLRFGVLWPKTANKNPKRTGMTSLGGRGLSSQSVWVFWPKRATKTRNGRWQAWEAQACHPSPFRGFLAQKCHKNPKRTGMTSLGSPGLSSQSVSGFSGRKGPNSVLGAPPLPKHFSQCKWMIQAVLAWAEQYSSTQDASFHSAYIRKCHSATCAGARASARAGAWRWAAVPPRSCSANVFSKAGRRL